MWETLWLKPLGVWLQVEYYFGDSSLPGDSFLLKKIEDSDDDCILPTDCLFAFGGLVGGASV